MAPITDEVVQDLKNLVTRLEARVHELESKIAGKPADASSQGMRMVIMGPPGAGTQTKRYDDP